MSKETDAYFRLYKGEVNVPRSIMGSANNAVDVLVFEGEAIEQLGIDGDSYITIPHQVERRERYEAEKIEKLRESLIKQRGSW